MVVLNIWGNCNITRKNAPATISPGTICNHQWIRGPKMSSPGKHYYITREILYHQGKYYAITISPGKYYITREPASITFQSFPATSDTDDPSSNSTLRSFFDHYNSQTDHFVVPLPEAITPLFRRLFASFFL